MGATYTRQSSYTDGDTITAAHTNDEFNQLLAAFAASTGHTHDGTANEGGPITSLLGTSITIGNGTAGTDITITYDGESNDGVMKWMEDEDYFEFSDDILIASTEKLQFRDTAIYINSSADGQLDVVADTEIQIAATTIDMNGAVDISGNLDVGGNLVVTGTTTFNGGTITMGDAATDNVVFGADINSSIIPNTDNTYDLGSDSQQWRNLYINGTIETDALTIAGVTLSETIADTVGAMVTSNTESGITVAYDDADNTLDFTVGTLNQDTTGNAATATALETARTIGGTSFNGTANIAVGLAATATALATARTIGGTSFDGTGNIAVALATDATTLETARTIHGVSFDGSANIDLSEVISDTVGAMVSSNTETGISVTYQDADNTIDFEIGAGAIVNSMLADDAVGADELAANAVVTASIVDANVTTAKITDGNVTTAKIAADAITSAKIADDAIDSEHYTDGSIDTAHISADAITEAKIADNAVESEHINDNVISGQTELASGIADTDELLISDAGTIKRVDASVFRTYIGAADDATALAIALG